MLEKPLITREDLVTLHSEQKKTQTEIAKMFNCHRRTIRNYLVKFNIHINPRLNLPLGDLIHYYNDNNLTTQQIGDLYKCNRRCIEVRLQKAGIKMKNWQRKYSCFYDQKLSEEQKEIIKGSLLGDGSVVRTTSKQQKAAYFETHCEKQLPYLQWKMRKLDNFISKKEPKKTDPSRHKSFSKGIKYRFNTIFHAEFFTYREWFYPEEKKIAPIFVLTPLSLAMWYYDDGDLHIRSGNIRLHTEGFDSKSVDNLQKMLYDSFSLESKIVRRTWKWKEENKQGYIIKLNRINAEKLLNIISSFDIKSLEYKRKNILMTP